MFTPHRVITARTLICAAASLALAASSACMAGDESEARESPLLATPAFNVLALYSGTFDDAHINFEKEAAVWFAQVAASNNFSYTQSTNWDLLNNLTTSQFQVVMFLDDQPSSAAQQAGFQRYMENGGGFFGFHVSAYNDSSSGVWPWFHQTLLGTGTFQSNTWEPSAAVFKIETQAHPATLRLPAKFTSAVSEWYSWQNDLRTNANITILASIDPSSFPLGNQNGNIWTSGYFPIVWTNKNFKMLYANFGHNWMNYNTKVGLSSTFASDDQDHLIIDGLRWLGGQTGAGVVPSTGPSPANWYAIANRASGKCVDARGGASANGTAIQQATCGAGLGQQFQFQVTSQGFVRINDRLNPAEALDVTNVSQADNAPIQLWSFGNGSNQQWRTVNQYNGFFRIVSKLSSKCLTVPNSSTADGVQLVQLPCNGTASQDFQLVQK